MQNCSQFNDASNLTRNKLCLVIGSTKFSLKIEFLLKSHFSIISKPSTDAALPILQTRSVCCIIIQIFGEFYFTQAELPRLKEHFPLIPVIAITIDDDLEAAWLCGKVGVELVVSMKILDKLANIVKHLSEECFIKVSLEEFRINLDECSTLVKKGLNLMGEKYLELRNVQELADLLGVSAIHLSKKFKESCGIGPKRLLSYWKLRHAVHLMKNPGLNLKQIANLVGYTNERRFNECFHSILKISPTECRHHINIYGDYNFDYFAPK